MPICGNSTYEMIEAADISDIVGARLLSAQINSINTDENTADITIAEECFQTQSYDTTNVKFYYHCEYSTGTVDDLSFGFSAFTVGDMVYVLYVPGSQDVTETMSIVGHIGIRGTHTCASLPIAVGALISSGPDGLVYSIWERLLEKCVDPVSIFMEKTPLHLLNVRYTGVDREKVSLITAQMAEDSSWQVIVDRKSGSVFRLNFYAAVDDLYISAAINNNLDHLYIVESRKATSGIISGVWYWYIYVNGEWTLLNSGVPTSPYSANTRKYVVDREGMVSGYWGTEFTSRSDQYTADGTPCGYGSLPTGQYHLNSYLDYNTYYGGYWDIKNVGEYVNGSHRKSPPVITNGDISIVVENVSSPSSHKVSGYEYRWSTVLVGYHGEWYRNEDTVHEADITFSATIGSLVVSTKDYGISSSSSGNGSSISDVFSASGAAWVHDVINRNFTDYSYHDGSINLVVTAGGWAYVVDSAIVKTPVDMSPVNTDNTYQYLGSGTWGDASCPGFTNIIESRGLNVVSRINKDIVYPESIGSFYSILRSFSTADQQSSIEYKGIQIQKTALSSPEWYVFKNGVNVTTEVEECTGKSIDQLYAIYYRA